MRKLLLLFLLFSGLSIVSGNEPKEIPPTPPEGFKLAGKYLIDVILKSTKSDQEQFFVLKTCPIDNEELPSENIKKFTIKIKDKDYDSVLNYKGRKIFLYLEKGVEDLESGNEGGIERCKIQLSVANKFLSGETVP